MNLETISEFSLAGVSALIVEDENLVAMDVENLLRDFGASRVWTTGALSEARRIMKEHADISIVLLDLKLRDGCGEELLAELVEANVPVIVTTGYVGFSCALAPVIYKPYSTEGLLEKIQGMLRRSGREALHPKTYADASPPFSRSCACPSDRNSPTPSSPSR